LCIHRPADKLRFLLIYAVHWPWRERRNESAKNQKLRHAAIKREKDKRVHLGSDENVVNVRRKCA